VFDYKKYLVVVLWKNYFKKTLDKIIIDVYTSIVSKKERNRNRRSR